MYKQFRFNALALVTLAVGSLLPVGCGRGDEETQRFVAALPSTEIKVYPTVIRTREGLSHDETSAAAIAAALEKAGARRVVVSATPVQLSSKTSMNQAIMFRASQRAFGEYVAGHSSGEEYYAVAEYLTAPNGFVGGIHLYVVRADGARVFGTLLNSHHDEFKVVKPRSKEQATAALLMRLADQLHI